MAILKMKGNGKKGKREENEAEEEWEIFVMCGYCFPVNGITFQPNKTPFKKTEATLYEKTRVLKIQSLTYIDVFFPLYLVLEGSHSFIPLFVVLDLC